MDLASQFRAIREAMERSTERTLGVKSQQVGKIMQLDSDLSKWVEIIPSETGVQIQRSRVELAHALTAAVGGSYRQAFSSLRIFLEISFAAVYFSANEAERRAWMRDKKDFSWKSALDPNNGVLSHGFVKLFADPLVSDASTFARDAADVYRTCSQYIHGKGAEQWLLPSNLTFNPDIFDSWSAAAERSALSAHFLLLVRYFDLIQCELRTQEIEDILQDNFSNLPSIRSLIGMAN